MLTPVNPKFYYIKVGLKGVGVKIIYACFRDELLIYMHVLIFSLDQFYNNKVLVFVSFVI